MANDIRPFRGAAYALLLLATGIFAAGIWTEMRQPPTDAAARMMTDVVAPLVQDAMPRFLGQTQTVFGAFAKVGGVVALLGLLLLTLRGAAAPAPAPSQPAAMPIVPRRPSAIRAARAGAAAPAAALAQPDPETTRDPAPQPASVAPRTRPARQFQRAALMLIGTVLVGLSAVLLYGRFGTLPAPAFVPPAALRDSVSGISPLTLTQAATAITVALTLVAILRVIRRRRAARVAPGAAA